MSDSPSEQVERQMPEHLKDAIRELVSNAYHMGMAHASGADVFMSGTTYTFDDLAHIHKEKEGAAVAAIESLLGEREEMRQALIEIEVLVTHERERHDHSAFPVIEKVLDGALATPTDEEVKPL